MKVNIIILLYFILLLFPFSAETPIDNSGAMFQFPKNIHPKDIKSVVIPWGDSKYDKFLTAISYVESGGGKYLTHPVVTKGIHEGFSAIGEFAIMPLTAYDYIQKTNDVRLLKLKNKTVSELEETLRESYEKQLMIARGLAKEYSDRFDGDYEKMAYAWYVGPYKREPKTVISRHFYVKRFLEYL